MPIYEYRCANGHHFEVFRTMSEGPVTACEECGAPTERVFNPVAVHFKGSGFYTTDYARKGAGKSSEGGSKSGEDGSKSDDGGSKSEDGGSKSEDGSGSKSGSKSGSGGKQKAEAGSQ